MAETRARSRRGSLSDGEVAWTTVDALEAAAVRLIELVKAKSPSVAPIVALYERGANRMSELDVELCRDLGEIASHAMWAKDEGAQRVAMEVNW